MTVAHLSAGATLLLDTDSLSALNWSFRLPLTGQLMDRKKLDTFRKQLAEKQEDLLRAVSKTDQDGREADEEGTQDLADKAANAYTKEFLFHQSNDNRQILALVNEALERTKNGSYGVCVECGRDVQAKRLEAVPWARHCIECQEKQDKGLL